MNKVKLFGASGYLLQTTIIAAGALLVYYVFQEYAAASPTSSLGTPFSDALLPAYFVLGVASFLLVAMAWIFAGLSKKRSVFLATGILGVLSIAVSSAFAWLLIGHVFFTAPAQQGQPNPGVLSDSFTALGFGGAITALFLAFLILNIVSLFSAANVFGVKYFRYAGWSWIASIVIGLATDMVGSLSFLGLMMSSFSGASQAQLGATPTLSSGFQYGLFAVFSVILVIILTPFMITNLIAALAFLKLPEVQTVEPRPEYLHPPPSPPLAQPAESPTCSVPQLAAHSLTHARMNERANEPTNALR